MKLFRFYNERDNLISQSARITEKDLNIYRFNDSSMIGVEYDNSKVTFDKLMLSINFRAVEQVLITDSEFLDIIAMVVSTKSSKVNRIAFDEEVGEDLPELVQEALQALNQGQYDLGISQIKEIADLANKEYFSSIRAVSLVTDELDRITIWSNGIISYESGSDLVILDNILSQTLR